MFESIMKLVRKVTKKEDQTLKSKDAAKERLHLVLMQDRANVSADFLDLMKQEIIDVIKKYIEIDESAIDVKLTNKDNGDGTNGAPALYANIPILNIKDEVRQTAKVKTKDEEKKENFINDNEEKKETLLEDNQEKEEITIIEENTKTIATNLSTTKDNTIDFTKEKLDEDEYITKFALVFDSVKSNFKSTKDITVAAKVIEGENLDVTLGNMPLFGEEKDAVKANVLKLLKEKYDIEEEDFVSAEIEVVPSGKARDYGLDRSMVAGYGHDDRVCAYTSLTAILDSDVSEYTSCAILVDKEEIGSVGATGAHSLFFENTVAELLLKMGIDSFVQTRLTMSRSKMLSSDVSAGVDPLFVNVNDKKNAAYLGNGIVFNKYTGSRGKSGSNDASAEYVAQVRAVMDNANIHYQTAELGRVDQGGGGTIAYILGNYNMDVIDAGIAVLNMHAPMEIVSKVDVYETYQAYKAFLKDA